MAFKAYLRVRDEMFRTTGPDLVGDAVIPGSERSGEAGINGSISESGRVRHHL
jgi:hypothetical protein